MEFRAQGRKHERPVGVFCGKPIEGHLQDLDLFGVEGTDGTDHPPVVGKGGGGEPLPFTEVGCPASGTEERVAKRGVARLALSGAEPDGQVESDHRIGVGGLCVEIECLGVMTQGVGWSQGVEGGVARLTRVADGLGQVDGLGDTDPVASQFAHSRSGAVPAEVLQGFGHTSVGPGPTVGTHVLVESVLDEGVSEVVVPGGVCQFPHQRSGSGGVEDVEQVVF